MEELFIQLVANKRYLYDKSHPEYKNTNLKLKTWEELGAKFNKTGGEAQIVFKSLREKYLREKKSLKRQNDSRFRPKKQWNLFPLMSFLDEHMKPRNTVCYFKLTTNPTTKTIDGKQETPDKIETNATSGYCEDITEYLSLTEEEDSPSCSSNAIVDPLEENTTFKPTPTKTLKLENNDDNSISILESVTHQYKNENSSFAAFCANLDYELNNMPQRYAEELKDEITMSLLNKRKEIRNRTF